MNPSSDNQRSAPAADDPGGAGAFDAQSPGTWREALVALISARVALIGLESKEAANHAARRAAMLAALGCCVFFAWALLLAGGIAWLARMTGWSWIGFAFAAAVLHLAAAAWLAKAARVKAPPAFPVTRAEFKKDREWIANLTKTRKSNG